jgi:hypothetical protein
VIFKFAFNMVVIPEMTDSFQRMKGAAVAYGKVGGDAFEKDKGGC